MFEAKELVPNLKNSVANLKIEDGLDYAAGNTGWSVCSRRDYTEWGTGVPGTSERNGGVV